ncbi:hypothetical protein KPNIH4_27066 [Klebsiella pneumoniae subsp. pneumoniae KPNIH4]|nr:hypothetical protein KPNIH4_27066 [Klebsiella pneumoniae subsp. pneumoniae KPNIH4]EJJ65723.1 hypothetical protein KPNIH8_28072 [Klebsiella pneumoniae subsp. pneumoniae KPNIH8]
MKVQLSLLAMEWIWHPIQKMNSFYSLMMIIFLKKGLFSVQ